MHRIIARDAGAERAHSYTGRINGGLALSRYWASAALSLFIVGCILLLPQRAGQHPGVREPAE